MDEETSATPRASGLPPRDRGGLYVAGATDE